MDLNSLKTNSKATGVDKKIKENSSKDIAIIGIALRLPKADNKNQFWKNLVNGVDSVTELPNSRLEDADNYSRLMGLGNEGYNLGSYLENIDKFDNSFFKISPKEAMLISPEQRLFLETVWNSIEDAGYGNGKIKGTKTGLYIGFSGDALFDYKRIIEKVNPELLIDALPGNLSSIIPSRISYLLDLKGPAMCIDSACSSSLVAVHQACKAIRFNDCDMAIAGGVKLNLLPVKFRKKLGIESSDGRARSFDDSADGTGMGEGIAAVLLKPLYKAERDKDHIYAVIKGSAVNQDGNCIGITAPNANAQAEVINSAWIDSGVKPENISYIEAHGTGTKLGDPIEIDGITKAFNKYTTAKQFCAIGSVKSNIGHLDSAAGVIGLIKAALALKYSQIPPSLHFDTPNKNIDFENSPVYVNDSLSIWNSKKTKNCGVSAFGLSGTNCHVVLQEYQNLKDQSEESSGAYIFTLSAKSEESLNYMLLIHKDYLKSNKNINLQSYCYTLNSGRDHYSIRKIIIFSSLEELLREIDNIVNSSTKSYICSNLSESEKEYFKGLIKSYLSNNKLDWSEIYKGKNIQKLSVPCYEFKSKRHWVEIPENLIQDNPVNTTNGNNFSNDIILEGREDNKYTDLEKIMGSVWGEALGYKNIDITDDFYDIGGDSIISMQIVNGYEKLTGNKINPSIILEYGNIKEVAECLEEQIEDNQNQVKVTEKRDYYPLSSAQKKMYIVSQFSDIGTTYNMPMAISVQGKLDTGKLEECLQKVLKRHYVFSTSFHLENGNPVQKIEENIVFNIGYFECKKEDNIDEVLKSSIKPFDLSCAPLCRVSIIKLSEIKHIIFVDMHHIITDGISSVIFDRELVELYNGATLNKLDYQYVDFSIWQTEKIDKVELAKQESFWLKQFEGDLPVLNLKTDFNRPPVQSFDGDRVLFEADKELTANILQLTKKYGATLFNILVSTYTILLSRYTGQDDILIATPISGRKKKEFENIIGMFVNTVVLRSYPSRDKSFSEYLKEVKEIVLCAFDNSDYPFEDIVEKLNIKRDLSRNPLFDTMITLQSSVDTAIECNDLVFEQVNLENNISKFDLNFNIALQNGILKFDMEYCAALFKREKIESLTNHYIQLLKSITKDSSQLIGGINMLTDKERDTVLVDFNKTTFNYPKERPVHSFITEHALANPENIAVQIGEESINYRELDSKSNLLAKELIDREVNIGDIIPIIANRSLELIIGMISVLKAGGAFLPIDPINPDERIKFMVEDCSAKIVLTRSEDIERLNTLNIHAPVIDLNDISSDADTDAVLNYEIKSTDLAYVIYTSGSTGKPKGVMVEHKSLINFAYSLSDVFDNNFGHDDNCLSLTSISFDVSVCEIFMPLVFGARLVMYSDNAISDLNHLTSSIIENSITFTYIPPTILTEVSKLLLKWKNDVKLNKLLVGVEPIKDTVLEQYININPEMKIINGYGPTEATICASFYRYQSHEPLGLNVPIGKPLNNSQILILDDNGNPTPVGVPGELCILGDGVARGYLNRDDLTKEKFVLNNFSKESLMYKTGDYAIWMENGDIEFFGRIDNQVKIRGYRVELGEIEKVFLKKEDITGCIVIGKDNKHGVKYLIAYYTADAKIELLELKEFLKSQLPAYMVPAFIVPLNEFPLTSNGKINRKSLPDPDISLVSEKEYLKPNNETDKTIINLAQGILEIERVSMNDNFFDIGGNSLNAITFSTEINRIFEIDMNINIIYELQEFSIISKYILDEVQSRSDQEIQYIKPEKDPFFGGIEFTASQKWFVKYIDKCSKPNKWNLGGVIEFSDRLIEEKVSKVMEYLHKHHDSLRASFVKQDSNWIQYINSDSNYIFKSYNIDTEDYKQYIKRIMNEVQQDFSIEQGPLYAVVLFNTANQTYVGICAHHLIMDGYSLRIYLEDFMTAYYQLVSDLDIVLNPKTVSIKQWTRLLNDYANNELIENEMNYWNSIPFKNIPDLPKDFNDIVHCDSKTTTLEISISEKNTKNLYNKIAVKQKLNIVDILLAAIAFSFKKWSGSDWFHTLSVSTGRENIPGYKYDLSRTIGWFAASARYILKVEEEKSKLEYVKNISDQIKNIPNGGCGASIIQYLNRENLFGKRLEEHSLVFFNYIGELVNEEASSTFEVRSDIPLDLRGGGFDDDQVVMDISAKIEDNKLFFVFNYYEHIHKRETIESITSEIELFLFELINELS